MTKPFGKPAHHGLALTKGLRLSIALWGAALPAYFLCQYAESSYPTLAESPFLAPATLGFTLFYAVAMALWLRRRPSPRAPGTSSHGSLFLSRFLLALFIATPAGFASAYLYQPALKLVNGLASTPKPVVEHALVDHADSGWVLDSPTWEHGFRWKLKTVVPPPADLTPGSLAKLTLRTGLLGARWIQSVEYTVLK
jgi:hypothetical protein